MDNYANTLFLFLKNGIAHLRTLVLTFKHSTSLAKTIFSFYGTPSSFWLWCSK